MFAIRASGKLCSRNLIPGCRLLSIKPHRPVAVKSEQEKRKETLRKEFEDTPNTAKIKLTWYTASQFKKILFMSAAVIVVSLYSGYVYLLYKNNKKQGENSSQIRSYGELSVGGPFELVDTAGSVVSTETLKGSWVLLYFGFTYCPDICPEQMELMAEVTDIAEKEHGIEVVPAMITIDLERDTPEVLQEYVAEYSTKIVGLLGTEEQVDNACNAYRCYRSKGQAYDDPNDYILDHTVTQYVINPDGKTVGYFMSNRGLDERVSILLDHVNRYNELKKSELEGNSLDNKKTWWQSAFSSIPGLKSLT